MARVVLLAGDGIGPEVGAAATKLLEQLGGAEIDENPLFKGTAAKEDRSRMNITFVMNKPELEAAFAGQRDVERDLGEVVLPLAVVHHDSVADLNGGGRAVEALGVGGGGGGGGGEAPSSARRSRPCWAVR